MIGDQDTKQAKILTAAMDVFARYGFRRTSMDDIAQAAGVSRPALYQDFSNKRDIFRAIVVAIAADVCVKMQQQVHSKASLAHRLRGVFTVGVAEPYRMMEAMPHGEEIVGLKEEFAKDLFDDWRDQAHNAFKSVLLSQEGVSHELAEDLAATLDVAIAGIKADSIKVDEMEQRFDQLLRVITAAAGNA